LNTKRETVFLVRYILTDQQDDRVIGIFKKKSDAEEAANRFINKTGSWSWTKIEEIPLDVFRDEDEDDEEALDS
jgi:hypothetical protein